ncbi:hypothetical protein GOP47_0008426 [Adiantum capillus-veneris]|uniref:Aminotransferase class I/classII large domain-containing protein n=1 Tax=Adiantum capillus-veneris TaxID=13818 RepID=A0A9D4ZKF2_ADICA|nr:hypothetical protein GOP47_0008426 [Adiantum capillus-veneris]
MVNTPHNPTGKVFSRKELELIASLCKEHDALAFTDEVYHRLIFGWKIGWAVAPPNLTWGVRQAHAFLTFATATPFQWASVAALKAPESFYKELTEDYSSKKDILVKGLKEVGFEVFEPQGTYFVMADHTPFGFASDVEFCKFLIEEVGVAAIPPSVFYTNPDDGKNLVRFAFCKDTDTLKQAVERMKLKLKKKVVSHA